MSDKQTQNVDKLLERLRQNYEDYLNNLEKAHEATRVEMRELIRKTFNDQIDLKAAQLTSLRYWAPRFELKSETSNQCPICSIKINGIKPDNGWVNRCNFAEEAAEMSANYLAIKMYWEQLGFDIIIRRDEANEFNGTVILQIIVGWLGKSKRKEQK